MKLLAVLVAFTETLTCKSGWSLFRGSFSNQSPYEKCIKVFDRRTDIVNNAVAWSKAEAKCTEYKNADGHDGHLVSIHTDDEANFVSSLIRGDTDEQVYWIGLRMNCPTCEFEWTDQSSFNYANWQDGEPNNSEGLENCVHINHNTNDVWNDQKCTWRMGYICQYYVSGSPLQPPQPPADGACPNDQWLKYAGVCYYASYKDKAINTAAETKCNTMLGASSSVKPTLAIMPTHWHQAFVSAELYSDAWIGIHSESAKGKHFLWSDGSSLLYSNWRMLHPTHNNLDIDQRAGVKMIKYYYYGDPHAHIPSLATAYPGDWEDILPTEKLPYICSTPAGGDPKWTSQGGSLPNDYKLNCPRDYKPYHSACYRVFTQKMTFDAASDKCIQEGVQNGWKGSANLVTIWNQGEEDFFRAMLYESFHYLTNSDDSIHIGLKIDFEQSDLTQKWAWIDNRTVSWSNWGPSQPAINTGTNCGYVDNILAYPKDWSWKMSTNCVAQRSVICKLDKYVYSDTNDTLVEEHKERMGNMLECQEGWSQKSDSSRYCWKLMKNSPGARPDAKANCERDGAHLATIYSEHDDAMVKNLMITGNVQAADAAWIGAITGQNGDFEWEDGSQMVYTNYGPETAVGSCLYMDAVSGQWNADDCSNSHYTVCKKQKKFEGCLATKVFYHCTGFDYSNPMNERLCLDMGCCFDPHASRTCFWPNANATDINQQSDGHSSGFAAGITALVCLIIYCIAGAFYFLR